MSASTALAYLLWLRVFYGAKRIITREKARLTAAIIVPSDGSYYFHDVSLRRGKHYVMKSCGSTECPPCQTADPSRSDEHVGRTWSAAPTMIVGMPQTTEELPPITGAHAIGLTGNTIEGPRPYTGQLKALVKVPTGS
jgi:hypothetical protein